MKFGLLYATCLIFVCPSQASNRKEDDQHLRLSLAASPLIISSPLAFDTLVASICYAGLASKPPLISPNREVKYEATAQLSRPGRRGHGVLSSLPFSRRAAPNCTGTSNPPRAWRHQCPVLLLLLLPIRPVGMPRL